VTLLRTNVTGLGTANRVSIGLNNLELNPIESLSSKTGAQIKSEDASNCYRCGYYDEVEQGWSYDGCETTMSSDGTSFNCECSHLSKFTIVSGDCVYCYWSKLQIMIGLVLSVILVLGLLLLIVALLHYGLHWSLTFTEEDDTPNTEDKVSKVKLGFFSILFLCVYSGLVIASLVVWDYYFIDTWKSNPTSFPAYVRRSQEHIWMSLLKSDTDLILRYQMVICFYSLMLYHWCKIYNNAVSDDLRVFRWFKNVLFAFNAFIATVCVNVFITLAVATPKELDTYGPYVKLGLNALILIACITAVVVYLWMRKHHWILEDVAYGQTQRPIPLSLVDRMEIAFFWIAIWILLQMLTLALVMHFPKTYCDIEIFLAFASKFLDFFLLYLTLNLYKTTPHFLGMTWCCHKRRINAIGFQKLDRRRKRGILRRIFFNDPNYANQYPHVKVKLQNHSSELLNDTTIIETLAQKKNKKHVSNPKDNEYTRPRSGSQESSSNNTNDELSLNQMNVNIDSLSPHTLNHAPARRRMSTMAFPNSASRPSSLHSTPSKSKGSFGSSLSTSESRNRSRRPSSMLPNARPKQVNFKSYKDYL
jgi:hypothetical protein